ncbi:Hypothetical predicted protein, partial [Mytilus galloprovincialis]
MDYFRIWLFSLLTWKSIDSLISINGYGALISNSQFVLACEINSFDGQATWSSTYLLSNTCNSKGFCTIFAKENLKFSGNSSGIFILMNPLLEKDDQIKWTCFYGLTNTSYTVDI